MFKEVIPFAEAWSLQKSIVEGRKKLIDSNEDDSDTSTVLQHQPVYTLGTASRENNLNFDIKDPLSHCIKRNEVVMLLTMAQDRSLEEVVIRVLHSTFSLKASWVEGLTGVWVGDKKLATIGIRVLQWLTYHGLALNVSTDLSPFNQIVIRDRGVASIKGLLNEPSESDDDKLIDIAHKSLLKEFCEVFQVELRISHNQCQGF